MNQLKDEQIKELLQKSFSREDSELRRDLWPQMLARLDRRLPTVPWFDWALIAVVVLWFALSPEIIPVLLYHL